MNSQLKKPSASSSSSRDAELSAQFSKASISDLPPLQNQAAQSTSPYVRAQAASPIAWQLLADDAVQRAKKENKLIYLNIGFKSCHCTPPSHPQATQSARLRLVD